MFSLVKNERGFRLASAAILLAPIACLVITMSRSTTVELLAGLGWGIFAAIALLASLYEKAEEESAERGE